MFVWGDCLYFLCTTLYYTLYFQKWTDLHARGEADEPKAKSEACALTC